MRNIITLQLSKYVTIIFNVPEQHADKMRNVLGQTGAGKIDNYQFCSFSSKGIGRFMPINNAQPHIGNLNQLETVIEEKIETICHISLLENVLNSIKEAHPYETITIDILPIYDIAIKTKNYDTQKT